MMKLAPFWFHLPSHAVLCSKRCASLETSVSQTTQSYIIQHVTASPPKKLKSFGHLQFVEIYETSGDKKR